MVELSRKSAERTSPQRGQRRAAQRVEPSYTSTRYTKKLPIGFISAKDWRLYIHFSYKVRTKVQIQPRGRIQRLLLSFVRLYQEYAYVCDNMLENVKNEDNNGQRNVVDEKFNGNECASRENDGFRNVIERLQGRFEDPTFVRFQEMSRCSSDYNNSQLKRWFTNTLNHFRIRKSNYTMLYDKIIPDQQEAIEIYSNERIQKLVSHRISFTGFDHLGRPTIKWIQVPIALELLIPKVQCKLQRIMASCNFLYDPLEVAAELRHFNYSVDLCISHFHKTKKLRNILENFLPQKSQLKDLETNPELWWKFQNFIEKLNNEHIVCPDPKRLDLLKNKTNNNSKLFNEATCLTKLESVKNLTKNFHSPMHSKLIKIICSVEKLKLTKADIHDIVNKWKAKYTKQILDYSNMIIHIVESFKDFLMTEEQRERVLHLIKQNDELKVKLKDEENKRKTIYNIMQDQIGNVRVYCRCRTLDKQQNILDIKANDTIMVQLNYCEEYKFDKVFESFRSQSDIYEELKPLIMSFIDGFNVCFITYGGEASGKTYTLLGPVSTMFITKDNKKHDGIMKRALQDVLSEESSRRRDWEYNLTGSIIEIYNDTYTDLLGEKLGIHLPIDGGLEKVQETLTSMSIDSDDDIETLIKVCKLKRKVGRTALNPHSSRSHLITIIHLTGRSRIHGESISSFLGLCDLAGFEDILKAETHNNHILSKEAGYINKSLTAFNRMFTSLRKQDPSSVSYRDTRLTYLLKPFLTNQGKCVLIVTVRTDKSSISSTQSTLRFGRESRGIALGKTKRQSNLDKIVF